MDQLTPAEVFIEAFFDRWEDYPPEEVRKSWERDLFAAFEKAAPALRSQERQRVKEALLADAETHPDRGTARRRCAWVLALFATLEDPEQPEGGDASARGHEAVPSTRVAGPGAGESGSRPETSEQPALSEGVGSGAEEAHQKKALLISSLRWAIGYIDARHRFAGDRPGEWDEERDEDWLEHAAAHDLLKDADRSAPPPQAVQGEATVKCECCGKSLPSECAGFGIEGEAFCGHCMQALDGPLVKAAKDLVDDLTGPVLELHKARVAPLRELLDQEYSFDCQPEKGGEG